MDGLGGGSLANRVAGEGNKEEYDETRPLLGSPLLSSDEEGDSGEGHGATEHLTEREGGASLRKTHLDYAGVAESSVQLLPASHPRLPAVARITVNTFLLITQFGFCCVYVLFIATNIKQVTEKSEKNETNCSAMNIEKLNYFTMDIRLYELILVALLIPLVFIKNIKHLAPFSAVANIASILGLGIILYYIFDKEMENFRSLDKLDLIGNFTDLSLYFGTAIYAFEGIGMVLPLENSMRKPESFLSVFGVLNIGMAAVCVLYIIVGFSGFVAFPSSIRDSITLNLKEWYGIAVQVLFSFCIFVSYALQFYVPMGIIGPTLAASRPARFIGLKLFDYLIRVLLVMITFGVAAWVNDHLNDLIALIGSFASSALALLFPPFLEILTFWPERHERKGFWIMFAKDIMIMVFGIFCSTVGTITAIQSLTTKNKC